LNVAFAFIPPSSRGSLPQGVRPKGKEQEHRHFITGDWTVFVRLSGRD
jgi:hypothetical protein